LSLAVGVVVSRCLRRLGFVETKLKWPNDILCHNKKLGGVLIEISGDLSGYCQAVIGIGLNIEVSSLIDREIDQPWTDLKSLWGGSDFPNNFRNQLLVDIISELTKMLSSYQKDGFAAYSADWNALNAYIGKEVSLINGDKQIKGVMNGVNEVGALCLETVYGEQVFHGGELSLRLS
jgi:BirA family transcriptional regulator, biotin operon repressor / biotin---[acetyl-CoA-carboxylase] ligase